jgi:hypothetical protein
MEDIQQHLLIQDLDYCNTACDDTEEIVGGGGFWKKVVSAVKGEVEDTRNAIKNTGKGLVRGTFPDAETAGDLFGPIGWRVLARLF